MNMTNDKTVHLPSKYINGHIFVQIAVDLWLIDTGSPTSFGVSGKLAIGDENFILQTSLRSLSAESLSQFIGVRSIGLIGMDILGRFDIVFDVADGIITFSAGEVDYSGQSIQIEHFMGIPIFTARINGIDYRMIFDTGAQISFFQHESRMDFPPAGDFTDFHPTFGNFQTDTYRVTVLFGEKELVVRCGVLTDPQLCATLTAAGVQGIVGNEILGNRIVCYFPRRNIMVISGEKPKADQPKWQNVLVTCSHGDCCEPGTVVFHRLICPECENVVWKVTQTRDEKYPIYYN